MLKVFKFFLFDKCSEYFIFIVNDNIVIFFEYYYNCFGIGFDKEFKVMFSY